MALDRGRSCAQPPLLNKASLKTIHNYLGRSLAEQVVSACKNQFFRSEVKLCGNHTTDHPRVCDWLEGHTAAEGTARESKSAWTLLTEQRKACAGGVKYRKGYMGTLENIDQIPNTPKQGDSENGMQYSLFCTDQQSPASPGKPL